jgi:PAS domain S-box-containing protein
MRIHLTKHNEEREELIRSIRLSPIASIVTDPGADDNPIISVNQPFELLTGYTESELVGRNCRILTGSDTERARSDELGRAIADRTPRVVELTNYRKDGSKFLNAVMIAPVLDADGELAFFVGSQMEVGSVRGEAAHSSAAERIRSLTTQQQAVLRLMARGMRNRQIGEELGVTEKTIKMHRGAMVRRLGVTTTAEAMRLAIEAGF